MRRTPHLRLLPWCIALSCIAAPAVAMIVAMTARGGDPPDDPAEAGAGPGHEGPTLDAAVAATRAVDRARVELQTTVAGPSGPVALVHRGAFVDGGARAQAESDMTQVAAALEAAGQQLDGDWSQPTGVVVDGDTVYSQLGPMAEALGRAPGDWTTARLADVAGPQVDNDTLALVLDPLGPLDLLRRPVLELERVGDEHVRGAPAQHLRARLDLTGAHPNEPAPGSFEARLVAAGFETLPVDVWVDAEQVVHRLVVTIDAAGTLTTTFEVFDVNADVVVAVPDPATVISP